MRLHLEQLMESEIKDVLKSRAINVLHAVNTYYARQMEFFIKKEAILPIINQAVLQESHDYAMSFVRDYVWFGR